MDYRMIVPVSSDKYDQLFRDATEFLKNLDNSPLAEGEVIDNLNAYYGHMKDFYNAAGAGRKDAYKYVMMPLNEAGEDPFKIDLNARSITVPASFAKIGAVQSDQMAELIVFSADRYFDYMDLANTLIYVQWQLPDADKTTGATEVTIIDIDSEPGKIRFAWPLHNTITAHSGIVKFSVRFFVFDGNEKLAYSLNTLEANIMIKPALDATSVITPERVGGLFEKSIINSQYSRLGTVPPVYPSFDSPGMDMTVNKDNFVRYLSEAAEAKKTIVAKLKDGSLQMKAQAFSADAGTISYQWKFKAENSEDFVDASDKGVVEVALLPTALEDLPLDPVTKQRYLNPRDTYYRNGEPYTGTEIPTGADGKYDNSLYEQYAVLTVSSGNGAVTGTYAVAATNTVADMHKERWSTHCYLPGPQEITFADEMFSVKNGAINVNVVEDINKPDMTYTWYYDALNANNAINAAAAHAGSGLSAADLAKLAPGWYTTYVVADLNGTQKDKATPNAQVVYAAPTIKSVTTKDANPAYNLEPGDTKKLEIVVEVDPPAGFTKDQIAEELYRQLSYKWQYRRSDTLTWKDVTDKMIGEGMPIAAFDPTDGSLTVRNVEDMTAYNYRCIVYNTLGSQKPADLTLPDDKAFLIY